MTFPNGTPVIVTHDLGTENGVILSATFALLTEQVTYTIQFPDSTISTWAARSVRRACIYCGAEVTATNPETGFCRGCFYGGRWANEKFGQLIADLPVDAYATHTGGGCFLLEIPIGGGRHLWASADGDGSLPETEDGPWWIGLYDRTDADDQGEIIGEHLDRAGLIAAITAKVMA